MSYSEVTNILLKPEVLRILDLINKSIRLSFKDIQLNFGDEIPDLYKLVNELLRLGIIAEDLEKKITLPTKGKEKLQLLKVVCEKDSVDSLYDLVMEEIITNFKLLMGVKISKIFFEEIEIAQEESLVQELLICSPWIALEEEQKKFMLELKKNGTGIFIVTRPPTISKPNVILTDKFLRDEGFDIKYYGHDLHTKLYMIKRKDYKNVAIFGSENLTNMQLEELGMLIKDERIYRNLEDYFLDLLGNSKPA